jgi:hypothetical protein
VVGPEVGTEYVGEAVGCDVVGTLLGTWAKGVSEITVLVMCIKYKNFEHIDLLRET